MPWGPEMETRSQSTRWHRHLPVIALVAALAGVLLFAGPATAASDRDRGAATAAGKKSGKGQKIHKAWPHKKSGKQPHKRLARKLARQTGPVRKKNRRRTSTLPLPAADPVGAGAGISPRGVATTSASGGKLLLVRSFDIPKQDPLYTDLVNFSWTYDNALATIGFVADKDRSQSRQLLDQLALLQNKDGSFNFAFDVETGAASEAIRSGAIAWVGLAGTAFVEKYGDKSYDEMIGKTIDYLLSQRNAAGLITGGPRISWASTQHNLLAAELLREAAKLSKESHSFGYTAADLSAAEGALDGAISSELYVDDGRRLGHFREGQNDDRIPIDVQALGTMYFDSIEDLRAEAVEQSFLKRPGFYIAPHVPPLTTPPVPGEVSGMRPFLDPGAPKVIWSEGTIQSQMAATRVGDEKTFLKASVESLRETIQPGTVGPIGADFDSDTSWGQYRTWPTSAAASWLLMDQIEGDVYLFSH